MRPTFMAFEIQKRTLQMSQKCIDIVGNNISNINTPGYTRQRVDLYSEYISGQPNVGWNSPNQTLSIAGQGVNSYGVSQIRDIYIDKRYRSNVATEAETEKMTQILSDIEDVLDDFENDGLQYFTQQFFNSLQKYSEEKPDSKDIATVVVNNAKNLCNLLNVYSSEISEIEKTYTTELSDTLDYINNMVTEMNKLNQRIEREKFHYNEEYGPNELYDEMNLYIDELATYGNISVTQHENGKFSVEMGGITLLDGVHDKTNRILMKDYDVYGQADLYWESGEDLVLESGSIKGYVDMINGNGVYATGHQNSYHGIAYFKSAIDEFARTLANTFNNANGGYEDEYRNMFSADEEGALITAANIHVSDTWLQDPTMIGMVRKFDPMTGLYNYGYDEIIDEVTGEVTLQNSNVLYLISQFDNHDLQFGNAHDFSGSIYEYISFISDRLAETISYESSRHDTAVTTVDTLLDARDEISAPDFNEEGINMMNYQKWFSASSRLTTTIDDMLDKLINGTGRVGL